MRERQVVCPACGVHLALPPECVSRVARCARCHVRFRLPQRISVTDEAVAHWLQQGRVDPDEDYDGGPQPSGLHDTHRGIEPPHSGQTAVLSAMTENAIRLARIDARGALFEFPAHRLKGMPFRTSMPRRCLQCGSRAHLRVHVIVYSGQLRDSISLEAEYAAGLAGLFTEEELRQSSCEAVIERLPRVPNATPPADLPMPYWVCDLCSGNGMLSGQVQVNAGTGEGVCQLQIRALRRAAEFFAAAGGSGTPEHHELMRRVAALADNPWESLPEAVQHRLEQWFRPSPGEQFIAYIPDRDHFRTEDGMAGFVISNRRLLYHSKIRHREATVHDGVELELAASSGKRVVRVTTGAWDLPRVTVDREGIEHMRYALAVGKFKAVWR